MKKLFVFLCFGFLFVATSSFASMISDSPYHDMANHGTAEWQQLGEDNFSDDAVWWSTDGGTTWGRDDISVGQTVEFKYSMWRAGYGRHDYDQIKSWIDWDQDNVFDNTSEVVLSEQWFKAETQVDDNVWFANPDNYTDGGYKDFFSGPFLISEDMIGELWLRARVHCNHTTFDNIGPNGYLNQGEVEDWMVTVKSVPEPATMLLLGFGLIGLAGLKRKFKK